MTSVEMRRLIALVESPPAGNDSQVSPELVAKVKRDFEDSFGQPLDDDQVRAWLTNRKPPAKPPAVPRFSREFVAQVNHAAETHLGLYDEPVDENQIRNWLKTHRTYFKGGKATVFRVMRLSDAEIDGLRPGDALGQHWTLDYDALDIDQLDINGHQDPDAGLYLFTGAVTTRDVAWDTTLAYNINFPGETEAFLDGRHGSITLGRINQIMDLSGTLGAETRSDLVGQNFRP